MNNFKKEGRFGGGGFNRSGGQSFGRSGGSDFGRNNEMHQTTCADCQKSCEVPFKPNGKKPVYCKDCFAKNGGQVSSGGDFQKKPFNPSYAPSQPRPSSFSPSYNNNNQKPQGDDKKPNELARQIEIMNAKFDKLIALVETLAPKKEVKLVSEVEVKAVPVKVAEKAAVKSDKSEKAKKVSAKKK